MAIEWGPIIAAGISAAGAVGSGWQAANINSANRKWNEEQAQKQRDYSTEMMNAQNAWNLEMWRKENEYNTPEAQLQRLRDAGLNPLYYGLDGTGNAGSLQSAQPLGYERAEGSFQLNPVATGIASAAELAQVANIQAQTEKTKSETKAIESKLPFEVDSLRAQIRNSNLSSDAQETLNKYIDKQQEAELRVKDATVAEADSMVQKAFAEIEKMDYEEITMFVGWLETNERILNLQKQRQLSDAEIAELASLVNKNNKEAEKLKLDVDNYDDIQVIGVASHNIKMGPFQVQEGEPITLGMVKAARQQGEVLKEKEKQKKTKNQSYGSTTSGSPYEGPIYD